ncbi:class I SAM-dependent methyltransferase [Sciscionella sediminilitoris]|uniref:class I SAM-dependent methyltransferase n=1 Tax=Sciscionella sediminilitoris TaxID=1445613 RepID=UPI0004DFAD98|nr:class I SAM-dependent methyltransferase [Sciscionella sp. SE31]
MTEVPDSTAVRTALWRARHLESDAPPPVFTDEIGLRLADPEPDWRDRADMDPVTTSGFRAGMVSRARFVEDLVTEQAERGVPQYVILGAGLDTFAQRRPDLTARLRVFEIDQPETQDWKRRRLTELGLPHPEFVPVDFEAGESWRERLVTAGFDAERPSVVAATGVVMYLTEDAIEATLREIARLAQGSVLALTFLLPVELAAASERALIEQVVRSARTSGTPFRSFFRPTEMLALARAAGFATAHHVSSAELTERYFANRADGLRPTSGEAFLLAET